MCYDISFTLQTRTLAEYFPELIFDAEVAKEFTADHILGHAYGEHPIILRNREDDKLHCSLMEWGVIPFYIKEEKPFASRRATMLNARSEKILSDSKSYWHKIRNRRCLVPVSGFYEHRSVKGFSKKIPYHIGIEKQPIFFLAGLYSVANIVDTETGEVKERKTFTIVTRAANTVMEQIHNGGDNSSRMPLMLPEKYTEKWLQNELSDEEYESLLSFEMPAAAMCYNPVYTIRSRNVREDGKAKTELYDWGSLPEIK